MTSSLCKQNGVKYCAMPDITPSENQYLDHISLISVCVCVCVCVCIIYFFYIYSMKINLFTIYKAVLEIPMSDFADLLQIQCRLCLNVLVQYASQFLIRCTVSC